MRRFQFLIAALVVACWLWMPSDLYAEPDTESNTESNEVHFNQDIRPLLSANCFNCHGPDEESREADLRLDTSEGAFDERDGIPALVAGNPDDSELYCRVASGDPDLQMPPPDSEHQLTSEEIALIKLWIEQGAPWQRHWSFVTPTRPELPEPSGSSEEELSPWIREPIDNFVLARLEKNQLAPSAEADRRTLIRRVTFDLTGLPPKLSDVQAFVADPSPKAYGNVIDRLLASEHYGEHMARFWLDAARYGDTHGLHLDNYREMWPYRDWVVGAFNTNLPYDQFLVEQLAGDLLPDATDQQKIASGFNRCHVTTNEGGSIDEEVYVRNVVDRVSTMGTVCLGMTVGCAVCHDHKFDPISQKEFYQFFAFFNNLDGKAMDGNIKDAPPSLRLPTDEQAAALADLNGKIESDEAERTTRLQAIEPEVQRLLAQKESGTDQETLGDVLLSDDGLLRHSRFEETQGMSVTKSTNLESQMKLTGSPLRVDGKIGKGIEFTKEGYVDLGNVADFRRDRPFSYGAWVKLKPDATGPVIAKLSKEEHNRGYELSVRDRRVVALLSNNFPEHAIEVQTTEQVVKPDTWQHVFITYDASGKASGVKLFVDGVLQAQTAPIDSLSEGQGIRHTQPLLLGRSATGAVLEGASIDELRLYDRRLSESEVRAIFLADQLAPVVTTERCTNVDDVDDDIELEATRPDGSPDRGKKKLAAGCIYRSTLQKSLAEWSPEQIEMFRQIYLIRHDPAYGQLTQQLDALRSQQKQMESQVTTTLVFKERAELREAFVLNRGEYDQQGEKVERKTPDFLPPFEESLPRNRLGLATWLVSDQHPLTSRVAINRFWQQIFGVGIVETSEDFGSQGTPPSHPELLDWLAVDFQESGWNVKALMKRLVMSATYRQSSLTTPELVQADPKNRLLAHGPRFRLDAEMLRDQALSIGGLLVDEVGGPSVKPPQPEGLWEAVGYSSSNTVEFTKDVGAEKIYRRSLYTFWKRTSPPPQMSTFDAPSRESCSMRRERTNTPLQALLLMNELQYVETARCFAEQILQKAGPLPHERVEWAFERSILRAPVEAESEKLITAYNHFHHAYADDTDAAKSLIALGDSSPDPSLDPVELATWTMMANVLLNLDEIVTKE